MTKYVPATQLFPFAPIKGAFEVITGFVSRQRHRCNALLFTPQNLKLVAKKRLSARMSRQPPLQYAGEKWSQRSSPPGPLPFGPFPNMAAACLKAPTRAKGKRT